jgi:hypothetical protein
VPYANEFADKTSHVDIINNPDIKSFLDNCKYMIEPTKNDIEVLKSKFIKVEDFFGKLPDNIISIDGSNYEASIRKDIPFTRLGYVKIGNLLIKRNMFKSLENGGRFVDPFKVAEIKENNSAVTFVFPSSNIRFGDEKSVRDGFRLALDKGLYDFRNDPINPKTSLRTTLFKLASYRSDEHGSDKDDVIILHKCPNCGTKNVEVRDVPEQQICPECKSKIYPSDCLRIWEEIGDNISNQSALTRFMNVIEHIFVIHYIRIIVDSNPQSFIDILNNLCFFVDGPLAIFGNAAWIHSCIMKYFDEINRKMREHNKSDIMVLGLLKSGDVCDYFQLISKHVPNSTVYCLQDDVRYGYVNYNDNPPETFGAETYYGQDFFLKTQSGRTFVFNIPYPFKDKHNKTQFKNDKVCTGNYRNLSAYIKLIEDFECDLYENAVVPIALAHKYTAISLEPGSRVLDLLSKSGM